MADFKPTAAQSAAIGTRDSGVLVSAGAGSGKTKVLTERLMAFVTDSEHGADLDSFLIITFTKAAAGELRGRIMDELAAALARDPGNKRLRRQSALCQRAQIGTIHSFCAALLREHSHLTGLSPDFRIMDEDRAESMKASALDRVMEKCYAAPDRHPGFLELADTVGQGRDDSRLSELVLDMHSKMQCHARPDLWAAEQVALLSRDCTDISQTPWGREIMDWARSLAASWLKELDFALSAMEADPELYKAYSPSFTQDKAQLCALSAALDSGWDKTRELLPMNFSRLGSSRKITELWLKDACQKLRDSFKKDMGGISAAMYADSAELLEEIRLTAPAMAALLRLTLDFDAAFAADKRRLSLVDYSDLEHLTVRLLTDGEGRPTELAEQLSLRYTEIMVDEYQDVSRVQDAIFHAISKNGRNLFMVGDVKQAIYRFRLADPAIFTEKYLSFQDHDKAPHGQERRILLRENFRSRSEVLSCANSVFSRCMSRALGDIDYDEAAALICGASYEGSVPTPELMLLELPKGDEQEEGVEKQALEARMVAEKIKSLVDGGTLISDKNGPRPLGYGDIAILLRTANTVGGIYHRALAAAGVPSAAGQSGSYFSSVEISTMMSMLAIVDNPHQDIPLIAVLRSPAFGFSADELSRIRSMDKEHDFYSALCLASEEDEKCAAFISRLERLREQAPDMAVGELLWQLMTELDMLAICSAMNDGAARRAKLMALVELSEGYEKSGYKGLHSFVLWLRKLSQRNREPAAAPAGSAVQIMSVHKSKGLEFPVVFLCDCAHQFNRMDSKDVVLIHPKLGLGPKVTDLKRRIQYPTLARKAITRRQERELLSEEMRLLYVALTRAKERLFMTAALKDPYKELEKARTEIFSGLSPRLLSSAAAPLRWLMWAALADGEQHMKITVAQSADLDRPAARAGQEACAARAPDISELERKLGFVYPHLQAEELPSKVTATELKGRREADGDAGSIAPVTARRLRLPDFARANKPLSGTEKGIAAHLVLQYMDFAKTGSLEEIRSEIARLQAERFISAREAEAVEPAAVLKLFNSELGRKLKGDGRLHREFKFSLLCDAGELFAQGEGEEVLLQGVVDCCIEWEDSLCIVDYKTDNVRTEEEITRRSAHYAAQLGAYAKALERIFSKPVTECALYFIRPGKSVILSRKADENL